MLFEILILISLTLIPLIELRLAIPVGILSGNILLPLGITLSGLALDPLLVFLLVVIVNIFLGFLLFEFFHKMDSQMVNSQFSKAYLKLKRTRSSNLKKYINKYGIVGFSLFIGTPLPGSGVYSGSLGAYVLGLKRRDFYIANILGVTFSGIIVTLLTILGKMIF
jgi:uncharacterized membrane protein